MERQTNEHPFFLGGRGLIVVHFKGLEQEFWSNLLHIYVLGYEELDFTNGFCF